MPFSRRQQGFANHVRRMGLLAIAVLFVLGACSPLLGAAARKAKSWRVGWLGVGWADPGETIAGCRVGLVHSAVVGERVLEHWVFVWVRMGGCEVGSLCCTPNRVHFAEV